MYMWACKLYAPRNGSWFSRSFMAHCSWLMACSYLKGMNLSTPTWCWLRLHLHNHELYDDGNRHNDMWICPPGGGRQRQIYVRHAYILSMIIHDTYKIGAYSSNKLKLLWRTTFVFAFFFSFSCKEKMENNYALRENYDIFVETE